jgi:hypothetical protein
MFRLLLTAAICVATFNCAFLNPASAQEQKRVLVHYMPWYKSKPFSGQWGWHWTMNHFDPEKQTADGTREIAASKYPLIGPYDSNDPAVLDCHVLLMKFAGVDGAIIDWYGIEAFRDYEMLHRNTLHFIKHLKKAGLSFAICYEDQTVKHMVAEKFIKPAAAVAQGEEVMRWMDKNWFSDPSYEKLDGRPVLAVFGPQYFEKQQWVTIRSGLKTNPLILCLPHVTEQYGLDGAIGWPPVHGGKEIPASRWKKYLDDLYGRPDPAKTVMAVAFPGYKDVYHDAKVGVSNGWIDDRDGRTFRETLDRAMKSKSKIIQIATWNDFGEGTIIEPTKQHGYEYLAHLQKRHNRLGQFSEDDLKLPVELYRLRKKLAQDEASIALLNTASELLYEGACDAARQLLHSIATDADQ